MENKKLKASENIRIELSKRTQSLKVKITSMSLAIYHHKMYTLADIMKKVFPNVFDHGIEDCGFNPVRVGL